VPPCHAPPAGAAHRKRKPCRASSYYCGYVHDLFGYPCNSYPASVFERLLYMPVSGLSMFLLRPSVTKRS
jgi:hypothetical protein